MMRTPSAKTGRPGRRPGDAVLLSILAADFFGALAGALVHLTMVWWVLSQGVSGPTVSLLVLCIFLPLNIGVLLTGVFVARYGSRRLLIISKLVATAGAVACCALLAMNAMTLPILAGLAIVTYGAMAPSIAADIARVPALAKLAERRLESFHAANGISLVVGQMTGLLAAGFLWGAAGPAFATGLGICFVIISTAFTWIGFPRDRVGQRSELSTYGQVLDLSRSVLGHLGGPKVSLPAVLVTATIIAAAQGCIEVAFPIAVSAAGLPATALSLALVLAVVAGVSATVLAERMYSRIRLSIALVGIATALLALLIVAAGWPGITGFYIAVAATAAAASGAGTLTITALQESMPVSLQAQAIGLWEFLCLSLGSVAIVMTGFTGTWSLYFIAALAGISVLYAMALGLWRKPRQA